MIELSNVQKVTEQGVLIDIHHLVVSAGEICATIDPTGRDNSILLNLLIGETTASAGTIRIAGCDPSHDRKHLASKVGVLFHDNLLYERHSARANLAFFCQVWGIDEQRADQVLDEVGLVDQAHVPAARLSSGMARRLAFGRAILHQPAVLLLQDLFNGCDSASASILQRLVQKVASEGAAVLILASGASGLSNLCGTIYRLEDGQIMDTYAPAGQRQIESPFKIPAKQEGQVILVNPADILYASAEGGQTILHTPSGDTSSHLTLSELEERLRHNGFFRAHRSYLVNLQRIKAIIPYTRDSYTLSLDDAARTEIPLSKTAAKELRDLLGY